MKGSNYMKDVLQFVYMTHLIVIYETPWRISFV